MKKSIRTLVTVGAFLAFINLPAVAADSVPTATVVASADVTAGASDAVGSASALEQAIHDQWLKHYGIEPGSKKAAIFQKWVDRVKHDPDIAGLPGGAGDLRHLMADSQARATVMKSGIARLTPQDRLGLVELITALFERAPADCYGTTDIMTVMTRATQPGVMSDEEADKYFGYVYLILQAFAKHTPVDVPTQEQRDAATRALGISVEKQITTKADIQRYAAASVDREHASPADVCWMTAKSLDAIDRVEEPHRDVLLRAMFLPNVEQAAQPKQAAPTSKPGVAPTNVRTL
ncbi:hypothetical protein [Burkholderia sp. Ac-20365]|uniref:hypothetical protein n=1 Tax=Burkholderia sp. Ac-20365 TaxID=2703897 RepID=UPI00197C6715|nr:hypothetical protein [Burkholderia sp. Ac-20365]MBN3760881.1 hypothetical protein [Burkholderia sp. Ac-20365]